MGNIIRELNVDYDLQLDADVTFPSIMNNYKGDEISSTDIDIPRILANFPVANAVAAGITALISSVDKS